MRQFIIGLVVAFLLMPDAADGQINITEIRVDQDGPDIDEYFELFGPVGSSLDGLSYLVIGDGSGGSGVIESVADLTGTTIPADGYFLAAEASFSLQADVDLTTSLNFENADNVTHLLVSGFTGTTNVDLDFDDDGVLDDEPWLSIVDCVAIVDSESSGEQVYCATSVGPDGASAPAHCYYDGGWNIGGRDPSDGLDTPGAPVESLPVQIAQFTGHFDGTFVVLKWTTLSEVDADRFQIDRLVDKQFVEIGSVPSRGDSFQGSDYLWRTSTHDPGTNQFRLRQIDQNGSQSDLGVVTVDVKRAEPFWLDPPYPNPTRSKSWVRASGSSSRYVQLSLFDVQGRLVRRIFEGDATSLAHSAWEIDRGGLSAGRYWLRLSGGARSRTRPLIFVR